MKTRQSHEPCPLAWSSYASSFADARCNPRHRTRVLRTDGLRRAEAIVAYPSPQNRIELLESSDRDQTVLAPLVICFTLCRRSVPFGSRSRSSAYDHRFEAPLWVPRSYCQPAAIERCSSIVEATQLT